MSWMRRLRSSLDEAISTLGPLDGVLYITTRLLERASGGRVRIVKYRVVAQPIAMPTTPLRPDANSSIAVCRRDDPLLAAFPRPAAVIARRFDGGACCLAVTVKQRFAGFLWLRRAHYEEDEVRCTFVLQNPASSVWDFDVYVEPAYRHGRTLARMWQAANERLHADGIRWTCSRISTFNAASNAAHARLGAVRLQGACFLVAGPWQLAIFSCRPFVHFSFGLRSCPRLLVGTPS